jgi:hypothetical protein
MIDKKAEMMKSQSLQVTPAPQQPLLQTIVNSTVNTSHASGNERKPSETVTSSMEDLGETDSTMAIESSDSTSDAAEALAAALGEEEIEEHEVKEAEASTEAELPVVKETNESAETSDANVKEKKTEKEDLEASQQNQEDSSNLKKVILSR